MSDINSENNTITLTFGNNIKVVVPDSLNLLTPYILQEQKDWFEDEIGFIREYLQPGMKAIDIGANYGLYTLSIAKEVGEKGKVWAFEPASKTALCLEKSIKANEFNNVCLENIALSNREGIAMLTLNKNAEVNMLVEDDSYTGLTEQVPLISLDLYYKNKEINDIDFIKIDAEGEESNIIEGGQEFFETESPLVMFEIAHRGKINTSLEETFNNMGYMAYRLLPGFNVLVPAYSLEEDDFQLNIFCCKPDRVRLLSERNLLIEKEYTGNINTAVKWDVYIKALPYSKDIISQWMANVVNQPLPGWEVYERALEYVIFAEDNINPLSYRYRALKEAKRILSELCEKQGTSSRMITLAKVFFLLGYRSNAVEILKLIFKSPISNESFYEPFLPLIKAHENLQVGLRIVDFVKSTLLEQYELRSTFSSFYSGKESLQWLETLRHSEFAGDEIKRRYNLINKRFSL